jgi:hypothetical protein
MAKSLIAPSHRGLLHAELGVPSGQKIGAAKLSAAKGRAKRTGNATLMKRVVFAQNFGHKAAGPAHPHDPGAAKIPGHKYS